MTWFLNLTTRNKLFVSFGLMFALMVWVIASAYTGISTLRESQEILYSEDIANVRDFQLLRVHQNQIRAAMIETQLTRTRARAEQDALLAQVADRSQKIDRVLLELLARAKNDPTQSARLEEMKSVWQAFAQTRETELIPLILAGKLDESRQILLGVQQERHDKIRAIATELAGAAEEHARLAVVDADVQAKGLLRALLLVGIVSLAIGVVLVVMMDRMIAGPLRELSRFAERVAASDLTVNVPKDDRADEVGILLRTFGSMVDNLRRTTRDLNEGVSVLAASSSEILATTTQLASGAAQTAAAVSETTATVEEVKQAAGVSSQKARYVSESAQKVAKVSQSGQTSVEATIQGMQRIQEQMESVAESIVNLSEQSQAIGEIIASVSGLAEQSNLLAVNAAIEAAKAGEQGKGFAVVAQEIKSLAEQSKQATAQVRTILGEIQKATGVAVMATEQGAKAVEAGLKQSGEAGESIRLLAESVSEAAQAATQIAASSQQQMVGMDQVAQAMESIKQASLQNVAGTRQAETAAHSLHELGQGLKQLAEQYKV
jgi:methyl-accepting chemotaxis protein